MDEDLIDEVSDDEPQPLTLAEIAIFQGDLSGYLDAQTIATLGYEVVRDYELDLRDRASWEKIVKNAIASAAQETKEPKTYPFPNASNVKYPMLTIAATEFNARSYPAIVKGDEIVQVKVIGMDKGRKSQTEVDPETGQPAYEVEPGAKAERANRVREFMNYTVNYEMVDWEGDTDTLLYQLPIVGCGFRKVWWDARKGRPCACYVPALRLVVPINAKSLDTAPRVTEEMDGVYPYEIRRRMGVGEYREFEFTSLSEDSEAPRMLLEQHRLIDLDGDGFDEPYIVTVDKETSQVLKLEAAFGPDSVVMSEEGEVLDIAREVFYVKYEFLPHPDGKFYSIGLGHLLAELGEVINTTINQMLDAGHAQIAGGGFIASSLRMQGNGQNNTLRFAPNEYKVVNASAGLLRDAIWERTFPNPSPIMLQLLDLILGAAKDIAAIKDVTSGDASNQGQVGTTLALIEQGLQVFTAIYKRVYRGLKSEFSLIFKNMAQYGGDEMAEKYSKIMDDPEADFFKDFNLDDMDVRPVSDPNSVTRMQKMAKAQFLYQTGLNNPAIDQRELLKRVLEAADVEDIESLMPEPKDSGPDPVMVANVEKIGSEVARNNAQAAYYTSQTPLKAAETEKTQAETAEIGVNIGRALGETEGADNGDNEGRLPDLEEPSDNGMGFEGYERSGNVEQEGMD